MILLEFGYCGIFDWFFIVICFVVSFCIVVRVLVIWDDGDGLVIVVVIVVLGLIMNVMFLISLCLIGMFWVFLVLVGVVMMCKLYDLVMCLLIFEVIVIFLL